MTSLHRFAVVLSAWLGIFVPPALLEATQLTGQVVDSQTGKLIPCRIYIRAEDGEWYFPQSASRDGSAVEYRKERLNSVEMHTTLSAHPFTVDLPSGKYTITVERGKEYHTETRTIEVKDEAVSLRVPMTRWINMAELGWYSGETHVHRPIAELPNLMLAEDLNVAFPLTYWGREANEPPQTSDPAVDKGLSPKPVYVDETYVYYPLNTEYEIFTVGGKRHTLGAVFIIGHKSVLKETVPPVSKIAEIARKEGALLELDKHNWPWSMTLIPTMNVDLYELSNNHIWRANFGFTRFGEPAPKSMNIEQNANGMTERGWIEYGFRNYYALLNCGFRLRPTAGTASGVHPVPLGFGRVYVQVPGKFEYDRWFEGLDAGRSFVTTGPMLLAEFNDEPPGSTLRAAKEVRIKGTVTSAHPLESIELIGAGQIMVEARVRNERTSEKAYRNAFEFTQRPDASTWYAVRCFEKLSNGRVRFAHTAPVHVEIEGKPLRPRRAEVEFLIERVRNEIERSAEVIPAEALAEYRHALEVYREKLEDAK